MGRDECSGTVVIRGEECPHNLKTGMVPIACGKCGRGNQVEVEVVGGQPRFSSFTCESCGAFNAAD